MVVTKAALNEQIGKDTMALLLDRRGSEIVITEEVVRAASMSENSGKGIMALLLDQRGSEIAITEDVVRAVLENGESRAMAVLCERYPDLIHDVLRDMSVQAEKFEALLRFRYDSRWVYHRFSGERPFLDNEELTAPQRVYGRY
jgi:hypothetical protein